MQISIVAVLVGLGVLYVFTRKSFWLFLYAILVFLGGPALVIGGIIMVGQGSASDSRAPYLFWIGIAMALVGAFWTFMILANQDSLFG